MTALRAETSLQAYARLIAGAHGDIAALAGKNPVNWLAQKPPNYLGEFYSPESKNLLQAIGFLTGVMENWYIC